MNSFKKIILCLLMCVVALVATCIPAMAAGTDEDTYSSSAPEEFTITSDMVDQNGVFSIELDDNYGFKGRITVNKSLSRASTDDFKLTGRFYKTSDGSTISDFWLSASFYVSSNKVYIDSYDSRHTKRTGLFSGYTANVNDTTASGEGTTSAKVRAEFELLLNGEPSPGTSETYLQVVYNSNKSWTISGNYDGADTP